MFRLITVISQPTVKFHKELWLNQYPFSVSSIVHDPYEIFNGTFYSVRVLFNRTLCSAVFAGEFIALS